MSTTRASTTTSARCSRSTPPACWCAARCSRSSAASTTQLPIFGNDIDFGWRAAAAGHRTWSCREAVVFHAEAAHRGVRRTPLTGRHTHYQERRAALYTLLANSRGRALPWQVVRLAFGTLLRMVGFLLVRAPGEALDELAALVSLYGSPRLGAARRAGNAGAAAPRTGRRPRRCWRRGGCPTGTGWTSSATWPPPRPTRRPTSPSGAGAAAEPARSRSAGPARRGGRPCAEDTGMLARFLTNPVALGWRCSCCSRWSAPARRFGTRGRRRRCRRRPAGSATGGGCTSSPGTRSGWAPRSPPRRTCCRWRCSALAGRQPAAAVVALLLLAVPLALWGAWRFLRVVGRLVDAAGRAALAALVGCDDATRWSRWQRRLGRTAGSARSSMAALLPWLAHAALGFADPDADRRWRAAWRTGLLLAVAAAFTPVACWFSLRARPWWSSAPASAICPRAMRTARSGDRRPPRCSRRSRAAGAVVAARAAARRGRRAAARRRPAAVADRRRSPTSSPVGSATPVRRPGSGSLLLALAVLALLPGRHPDPGAGLLGRRPRRGGWSRRARPA